MKNATLKTALLSPLSKILTIAIVLISSLYANAKTHYAITVVSEASVMAKGSEPTAETFQCKNSKLISKAVAKMGYERSTTKKAEKVMQITKETTLFAFRNTDDGYLNSVTVYLAVHSIQGTKYYPLTEVDMERFELPEMKLKNNILTVEADTLTVDPLEENDLMKVPVIQGRLYQTVQIGEMTADGLQITTLSCSK